MNAELKTVTEQINAALESISKIDTHYLTHEETRATYDAIALILGIKKNIEAEEAA